MRCARALSLPIRYVWALPNTLIGLLLVLTAMLPRGRMQVVDGVLEAHGPLITAILRHCVLTRRRLTSFVSVPIVFVLNRRLADTFERSRP